MNLSNQRFKVMLRTMVYSSIAAVIVGNVWTLIEMPYRPELYSDFPHEHVFIQTTLISGALGFQVGMFLVVLLWLVWWIWDRFGPLIRRS
jgi:hypothetical protein